MEKQCGSCGNLKSTTKDKGVCKVSNRTKHVDAKCSEVGSFKPMVKGKIDVKSKIHAGVSGKGSGTAGKGTGKGSKPVPKSKGNTTKPAGKKAKKKAKKQAKK